MPAPASSKLLQTVLLRLQVVSLLRSFSFWLLIMSGSFGAFLIASRLLGWGAAVATWQTLMVVVAAAVALAVFIRNRPTLTDAARRVDAHGKTKDLFLTMASLDSSRFATKGVVSEVLGNEDTVGKESVAGHSAGYEVIVAGQAELHAPRISPSAAVPVTPDRRMAYAFAVLAGAVLGVALLPQWDPFGVLTAANAVQALQTQLNQERLATQTRVAKIKKDTADRGEQTPADQSIESLKTSLQQMKPQQKQPNLEKLNQHQGDIGTQWRTLGAEKLKSLLSKDSALQDFGGGRMQKMEEWSEQLKQGESQLLQQEVEDLAKLAQEIAQEKDPARRAELAREMKERLKDLERFASERVGSPEMAAAVRRAMRQMEAGEKQGLDQQMLKDLQESLELSKMEMQQLANDAQEMQKLEEALKTMQMAKQLNEKEKLDGEACQNCQTLEDYADLYAQMMGQSPGEGEGMGDRGFGKGGEAPEDDSAKSAFQDETSKSAVTAGKTLLSMKTRGMGERGVVQKDYRQQVETIKQSVSEAILQEQIPPGYHESIRNYFDSIQVPDPNTP